jgi:hypothetical protein
MKAYGFSLLLDGALGCSDITTNAGATADRTCHDARGSQSGTRISIVRWAAYFSVFVPLLTAEVGAQHLPGARKAEQHRLPPPDDQPGAERPSCLVHSFDVQGFTNSVQARMFREAFMAELGQLRQYRVIDAKARKLAVDEQRWQRLAACSSKECAIEAGALSKAQYVAYGSVMRADKTYFAVAFVADVRTSDLIRQAKTEPFMDLDVFQAQAPARCARILMGLEQTTATEPSGSAPLRPSPPVANQGATKEPPPRRFKPH